jgi:hypothetical protein
MSLLAIKLFLTLVRFQILTLVLLRIQVGTISSSAVQPIA